MLKNEKKDRVCDFLGYEWMLTKFIPQAIETRSWDLRRITELFMLEVWKGWTETTELRDEYVRHRRGKRPTEAAVN